MWSQNKYGNDRIRRQTKNVMSDDDGDEKRSRRTVRINICTCRTVILVPYWHIDFPTCKKSMWEWSPNKDGNIRIRRHTTKSSCQTTMAMTRDGDGRCESIFVHIELLISVPHWHIDFCKNMQKVMCRWSHNADGNERTRRQTSTRHVKRSVEKQS